MCNISRKSHKLEILRNMLFFGLFALFEVYHQNWQEIIVKLLKMLTASLVMILRTDMYRHVRTFFWLDWSLRHKSMEQIDQTMVLKQILPSQLSQGNCMTGTLGVLPVQSKQNMSGKRGQGPSEYIWGNSRLKSPFTLWVVLHVCFTWQPGQPSQYYGHNHENRHQQYLAFKTHQ